MADIEERMFIAIVSAQDFLSIIANVLFIVVIQRKTPRDLSSYSRILLLVACIDLTAAVCSCACVCRILQKGGSIAFIFIGPCTRIGPELCHFLFVTHTNLMGQSNILLLISFTFRLGKINVTGAGVPKISLRFWIAIVISITYAVIAMAMELPFAFLSASYQNLGSANEIMSSLDLAGGITDNLLPRVSIFLMLSMFYVIFTAIFAVRRKLFARIRKLSSSDRYNHQMIYRALTTQLMLPLFYIVGSGLWILDAVGVVHSLALQRSIIFILSIFPLASPLINMYFIPPYRRYLKSIYSNSPGGNQVSQVRSKESNHKSNQI